MKSPTPVPPLTFTLTFTLDIAAPAKSLAEFHAGYARAVAERDRLTAKRITLKEEEANILKSATLEDPATFRVVADIRLALEILERKLAEEEAFISQAGPQLTEQIRNFIRVVEAPLKTASGGLHDQSEAIRERALAPFAPLFDWLKSGYQRLGEFERVLADNNYSARSDAERLRNAERVLAAAAKALAPLPTPPAFPNLVPAQA